MISRSQTHETTYLPFGRGEVLRFDLPPEVLVGACGAPRGEAQADVRSAARAAIEAPLGFPPLSQVAFPGDRVVLAVAPGTPQAARLVAALVAVLRDSGVSAELISVLTAAGADGLAPPDLTRDIAPADRPAVAQHVHDPQRHRDMCRIGESRAGRPLVVNRLLFDADLVITLGAIEAESALGYFGVYGALYPTLSDAKTQRRYRAPCLFDHPDRYFARTSGEAAEVAWMLGAKFSVQVVPGAGDDVLAVLAGDADEVAAAGRRRFAEAWTFELPRRAQLVVAAVDGEGSSHSWDALARALASARRVVADAGVIAVCSALDARPGAALKDLRRTADPDLALRRIRRERSGDMPAAEQLARALGTGRVYLLSRLAPEFVEDLGIAPVSEPIEIERLAARSESCILLANAQHVIASASEE